MKPRVLALTRDVHAAIAEIRLARPFRALQAAGRIDFRLRDWSWPRRSDLHWSDVVVLQRPTSERELRLAGGLARRGVPWVYEIDDLLTDPAPQLMQRAAMLDDGARIRALLRAADSVSTTTARLADALRAEPGMDTARIALVPNIGWPVSSLPVQHDRAGHATLILASSDVQALGGLASALHQAMQDPHLHLLVIGPVATAAALEGLPPERVKRLPTMPHADFVATVMQTADPLALMPLDASAFSACKSAIKYFDYALAGIPALCVNRPPYSDHLIDGVTGWLVADEPAAWLAAIRTAQGNAALRTQVAQQARQQVRAEHPPHRMADAWLDLICALAPQRRARPGSLARAADWAFDALRSPLRAAQAANRNRLQRRRAAGPPAGTATHPTNPTAAHAQRPNEP